MIRFTKMHGLGNDYVLVDLFEQDLAGVDVPALARAMSDRHRGIGSDGLILIRPPDQGVVADVRMEMYNADGSRGEMCGNGIRCLAKYVVEQGRASPSSMSESQNRGTGLPAQAGVSPVSRHRPEACATGGMGIGSKEVFHNREEPRAWALAEHRTPGIETAPEHERRLAVQTDRGVLPVAASLRAGRVHRVRVEMGTPILKPSEIPVRLPGERCVRRELLVGSERCEVTCVSMGNPHAVMFVESMDSIDLAALGPQVERHALFPNRVNLHVASLRSRCEAVMRSWERGSGLTLACGTGACAVLVAGVLEGRLDRAALIHLPGGDLRVEWADSSDGVSGPVLLTGSATEVFRGEWPLYYQS